MNTIICLFSQRTKLWEICVIQSHVWKKCHTKPHYLDVLLFLLVIVTFDIMHNIISPYNLPVCWETFCSGIYVSV